MKDFFSLRMLRHHFLFLVFRKFVDSWAHLLYTFWSPWSPR